MYEQTFPIHLHQVMLGIHQRRIPKFYLQIDMNIKINEMEGIKNFQEESVKRQFNLPASSPAVTCNPDCVHDTLLNAAAGPSTETEAVDTSVSLFKFHRSKRPVPSTVANRAGCVGLQATS